jgi:hypothetical protein
MDENLNVLDAFVVKIEGVPRGFGTERLVLHQHDSDELSF